MPQACTTVSIMLMYGIASTGRPPTSTDRRSVVQRWSRVGTHGRHHLMDGIQHLSTHDAGCTHSLYNHCTHPTTVSWYWGPYTPLAGIVPGRGWLPPCTDHAATCHHLCRVVHMDEVSLYHPQTIHILSRCIRSQMITSRVWVPTHRPSIHLETIRSTISHSLFVLLYCIRAEAQGPPL